MLTKAEVVEILNGAFRPLTCVAELTNYENAVGLRVYDASGVVSLIKWECESVDRNFQSVESSSSATTSRRIIPRSASVRGDPLRRENALPQRTFIAR